MPFKPVQKLAVSRTLASGEQVQAGVLVQNRQGVFFQYDPAYVHHFGSLSPFYLPATNQLQPAPAQCMRPAGCRFSNPKPGLPGPDQSQPPAL